MTVKELMKELKKYPADAKVYMVGDPDVVDEQGRWDDLTELDGERMCSQEYIVDLGLDWQEITEVLIFPS